MPLHRGLVLALVVASLVASSCTQVSVEGPCTVESNSTITLDVRWALATSPPPLRTASATRPGVHYLVRQAFNGRADRAESIGTDAANDSVLVIVDAPASWTLQTSSGDINDSAATIDTAADAPFCADEFASPATGMVRTFFRMSNGATLVDGDEGVLHVTFATGTVEDGVYHPRAMVAAETDSGAECTPSTSFHRVVAGNLAFVNFDVASHLNADVVVNTGDVVQDKILSQDVPGGPLELAFGTESVLGEPGLPDDGLVSSDRLAAQLAGIGAPVAGFGLPECVPPIQLAFSDDDDGFNAWLQPSAEDSLTFDVPPARYAEIMLLLTPAISLNDGGTSPSELLRAIGVTFHYSDASTSTTSTLLPFFGLPVFAGQAIPENPYGELPAFMMALGGLTAIDGTETPDSAIPGGISAVMATPDPAKTLTSVTIEMLPIGLPAGPATQRVAPAAVDPVSIVFFGAAGMQFAAEPSSLSITKQALGGASATVGDDVTFRITATCGGPGDCVAVTLSDALPSELLYSSATASDGACTQAAGTVSCDLGLLAAGSSEYVDIVATVTQPGAISNTATGSQSNPDTSAGDNSGVATITAAAAPAGVEVPTLSEWGLALLVLALGVVALLRLKV